MCNSVTVPEKRGVTGRDGTFPMCNCYTSKSVTKKAARRGRRRGGLGLNVTKCQPLLNEVVDDFFV